MGLDYGTLSCRALLVRVDNGQIAAESEYVYPHGVMDKTLPDGTALPAEWALEHPQDHLDALLYLIPELMDSSGVTSEQVAGIGIDSTASTVMALDKDLMPLCFDSELQHHPHGWTKLWKHHAAGEYARRLTETAKIRCPESLKKYGGMIGAESLLAKVIETCVSDPEVYDRTYCFMELGDWITSLLTGCVTAAGPLLTCKAMWDPEKGYPDREFLASAAPEAENASEKLAASMPGVHIAWPGEEIGTLCPEMAEKLGLRAGTPVSAAQMDGYAGFPGSGAGEGNELLMMIGTSTAFIIMDREQRDVPGVCNAVKNSNLSGFVNYAAGQGCVGDMLAWFINNSVPGDYGRKAAELGMGLHEYLSALAEKKKPGETGLLALDWFNGNKSCLADPELSGMILGMDIYTRPEDIYRCLIEGSAFGARKIIENYEEYGVRVDSITACGGIARKNPFIMQIYSDVIGRPISAVDCPQAGALGSAVFAAAAAGIHPTVTDAIRAMADHPVCIYRPNAENRAVYESLYSDYMRLHDWFGVENRDVMHRMKKFRAGTERKEKT